MAGHGGGSARGTALVRWTRTCRYIPSLRVLKEGGYEGGGAMAPYGQPAPFRAAVEEIIAEKVDELVKRARVE